jgi:hypothetical protein
MLFSAKSGLRPDQLSGGLSEIHPLPLYFGITCNDKITLCAE